MNKKMKTMIKIKIRNNKNNIRIKIYLNLNKYHNLVKYRIFLIR